MQLFYFITAGLYSSCVTAGRPPSQGILVVSVEVGLCFGPRKSRGPKSISGFFGGSATNYSVILQFLKQYPSEMVVLKYSLQQRYSDI